MCGIAGYVGGNRAVPILLDALHRLEYRGYDSAGLATWDGSLHVRRTAGEVSQLASLCAAEPVSGCIGIAHTRWATHGAATEANAHPHTDCHRKIAVVHKGIIENHRIVRELLLEEGHRFRSDTDTEVIAHLIEVHWDGDLEEAVRRAVAELEGSFALVVLSEHCPDRLIAVRHRSPLVIGLGEGENFIASDIPAIAHRTRSLFVLEDGEMAVVRRDAVDVRKLSGQPVSKRIFHVQWTPGTAGRGLYDEFMAKEIDEQPAVLRRIVSRWQAGEGVGTLVPGRASGAAQNGAHHVDVTRLRKIWIAACGTAYHAGLAARPALERWVGVDVSVELASEFRYGEPRVARDDLFIAVSQSGETADTLAALEEAARRGARTLAVVNVEGSSIARAADHVVYTLAGPEQAVASTKAYTAQVVTLAHLAAHLGILRGQIDPDEAAGLPAAFRYLPEAVEYVLCAHGERLREVALRWKEKEHALFIGRGLDYAVAAEGQLKLKEVSYIHAEAVAAGELKHGTLALVSPGFPVVAVGTQEALAAKLASNVQEVKARGADVLAVANAGATWCRAVADHVIYVPRVHPMLAPVVAVVPLQLLAYHAGKVRGCPVDKPRNLAKSVTVE